MFESLTRTALALLIVWPTAASENLRRSEIGAGRAATQCGSRWTLENSASHNSYGGKAELDRLLGNELGESWFACAVIDAEVAVTD